MGQILVMVLLLLCYHAQHSIWPEWSVTIITVLLLNSFLIPFCVLFFIAEVYILMALNGLSMSLLTNSSYTCYMQLGSSSSASLLYMVDCQLCGYTILASSALACKKLSINFLFEVVQMVRAIVGCSWLNPTAVYWLRLACKQRAKHRGMRY